MTYFFYTLIVLIGVFCVAEIVDTIRGRDWGENP